MLRMKPMPFADRLKLLSSTNPGGCWIWEGGQKGPADHPYGAVKYKRRSWLAHRLAYEMLVGPIPDGMPLDHLCRVRLCFNPKHLEPVTTRTNLLRGLTLPAENASKTHCKHGHPLSGDNLYVYTRDGISARACKTCRQNVCREYDRTQRQGRHLTPERKAYVRNWKRQRRARRLLDLSH